MDSKASLIPPVADASERPLFSVMIPAYNPARDHLAKALGSLLDQDAGENRMQIEVVDDNSTKVDVARLVSEIAGDRVKVRRTAINMGLSGSWNECIKAARGLWVHLLHQDDWLYPGFYKELMLMGEEYPKAGALCTRHAFAAACGTCFGTSAIERPERGRLNDWYPRIASWQRMQCVAVAVRRECYELLGGFRDDLAYVLDWEMWARIARSFDWVYSPSILAVYRMHDDSATARLKDAKHALPDFVKGFEIISSGMPRPERVIATRAFRSEFSQVLIEEATSLFVNDRADEALGLLLKFGSKGNLDKSALKIMLAARCLFKQVRKNVLWPEKKAPVTQ